MPRNTKLRLTPELVPKPLWGISAYRILGRGVVWKAIRGDILEDARHRCSICGCKEGQLTCHEKWLYNDKRATATLIGFEIHCVDCDAVAHSGRAMAHGFGDVVVKQLCKVNGCTQRQAERMIAAAMLLWQERSRKQWGIEVTAPLLKAYPQLEQLDGRISLPVERGQS
jgi:hypothetical protein